MARRGPKPAPTALRVLRGERADRINSSEPKVDAPATPPPQLSEKAAAEWHRLAPVLTRMRVLTEADADALAQLCECVAQLHAINETLSKDGLLASTAAGGIKLHPLLAAQAATRAGMLRLLAEFGLTPSSRSRLKTPEEAPVDALSQFLAKRS